MVLIAGRGRETMGVRDRTLLTLFTLLPSSDGGSGSPQVGTIAGHGSSTMADTACPVRGLPILVVDQTLSDLLALCLLLEGETAADAAIDDGPPVCTWM
ncbi:hypothetical protein ACLOJK_036670 [Asimina triloba]